MKIIIPEIPPSLNKYAGRANTWDYRAEKQRWLQLFVAYCPKCKPMGKAVVTITYYFPTRHRHDPDNYNPFASEEKHTPESASKAISKNLSFPSETPSAINLRQPGIEGLDPAGTLPPPAVDAGVLLIAGRYLITATTGGAIVVDRHRAHVKILYERFLKNGADNIAESQQVLFPETVSLAPSQHVIMESIKDEAATAGFTLEYKGDNIWEILAVPATLGKLNPKDVLLKMIEAVGDGMENGVADTAQAIHRHIALSLSRSGAVRPGDYLSPAETEELLGSLFALPDPQYTPDGARILFELPEKFIASQL